MYDLTQASFAKTIVGEVLKRGGVIPAPFNNPPTVSRYEEIFMSAWVELDSERTPSDNPNKVNRITRKQIKGWLIWHEMSNDPEFSNELVAHIFALDTAFIPIQVKRQQNAAKKAKGGKRGKGNNA